MASFSENGLWLGGVGSQEDIILQYTTASSKLLLLVFHNEFTPSMSNLQKKPNSNLRPTPKIFFEKRRQMSEKMTLPPFEVTVMTTIGMWRRLRIVS